MIVAGFGFRSGATAESLANALDRAGDDGRAVAFATAADKAHAEAFIRFAEAADLPVEAIDAETLTGQDTVTRSVTSLAARGTGSVAEAAALAAAGPGARLIARRVVSRDGMATCALAEGNEG